VNGTKRIKKKKKTTISIRNRRYRPCDTFGTYPSHWILHCIMYNELYGCGVSCATDRREGTAVVRWAVVVVIVIVGGGVVVERVCTLAHTVGVVDSDGDAFLYIYIYRCFILFSSYYSRLSTPQQVRVFAVFVAQQQVLRSHKSSPPPSSPLTPSHHCRLPASYL